MQRQRNGDHRIGQFTIEGPQSHPHRLCARESITRSGQHAPDRFGHVVLQIVTSVDVPAHRGNRGTAHEEIHRRLALMVRPRGPTRSLTVQRPDAIGSDLLPAKPLGYPRSPRPMGDVERVSIDSVGVSERTAVVGVYWPTLREDTERPDSVREETTMIVAADPARILDRAHPGFRGDGPQDGPRSAWHVSTAARTCESIAGEPRHAA